jgi:tetratricopeptide (TPR) repeat protein
VRIALWGFLVFPVAVGACYLGWQSFRSHGPIANESRPDSSKKESVFAGIADCEPALSSDANATDVKQAAIAAADALVAEFPGNVAALAVSATLHARLGETEDAARLWRSSLEIDPAFSDAYRQLGQFARDRGDFEEASEMLGKLVALGQASPEEVAKLGDSLLHTGAVEDAVNVLEQHTKESPVSENALLTLGQAYQQTKEYEKAEATFRRLVEMAPANARAYYALANLYARSGQREKSRECSEKFRSLAKVDFKQRAQELRSYTDISTLHEILAQTLFRCGHVYAAEGQLPQAEVAWLETAIVAPRHTQCRYELLYLFEKQSRVEDALEISRQLCELEPESPDNWLNLGVLNGRLEQQAPALAALEKAMQLAPENPKYRRAYDLVRQGM